MLKEVRMMEDKRLEGLLKDAFDGVRCEQNLKNQTLENITNGQTKRRQRIFAGANPNFSLMMRGLAAAACCVIALLTTFGVYTAPAAAICLDGDMSMRLIVNRFDRVLDVTAYNENAKSTLRNLNIRVKGNVGKQLLRDIVASDSKSDVEVYIISDNEKLSGAILADVTSDSSTHAGVSGQAHDLTDGLVCQVVSTKVNGAGNADADKNKMTYQRYELYKKIQVLGIGLTENQVRDMSLNDLRAKIAEAEMQISASNGNGTGNDNVSGESGANQVEIGHGQGTINNHNSGLVIPTIIEDDQKLDEQVEIKINQDEMDLEDNMESDSESEFVEDGDFDAKVEFGEDAEFDEDAEFVINTELNLETATIKNIK